MLNPYLMTTTRQVIKTMQATNQEHNFPVLSEKLSKTLLIFCMFYLLL